MNRINIINELIKKNNYKSYLEIGVRDGSCFKTINCEDKIGVDPDTNSEATYFVTSDEFFKNSIKMFDIIFIDGLHESEQVMKDIQNSLSRLTDNGTIVMHDCLPTTERMQQYPDPSNGTEEWTGDTWKAFLNFRQGRKDLEMYVVDTDYGCGIIRFGKQEVAIVPADPTYDQFTQLKHQWMNVISVEEFKTKFLN